ncbi:MAG: HNH endonuclease [Bacteroidota bacterium]
MRPLDKGACPKVGTANKTVTEYGQWRRDLIDRIGYYCAYCNMPLSHQLQVEHVIAKVAQAGAIAGSLLDWDNLLLACGPCNNVKKNKPCDPTLHYLPESHNTHLPFEVVNHPQHPDAAIVSHIAGLTASQEQKAKDTIDLFGLDAYDARNKVVDLRWMKRKSAIATVAHQYDIYQMAKSSPKFDATIAAKGIVYAAKECGFFSLWYNKFINEPEVMRQLTDNSIIPGTASNCFDAANGYKPKGRNLLQADPI